MRRGGRWALAGLLLLAACAPSKPEPARLTLEPVAFGDLPGWREDGVAQAVPALLRSCRRFLALPPTRLIGRDGLGGTAADWMGPCAAAERLPDGDDAAARAFFEQWFEPYRAGDGEGNEGLFTGYYEADLTGSRQPDARYRWPIYGRPDDLVTVDLSRFLPDHKGAGIVGRVVGGRLEPYPTHAEIAGGKAGEVAQALLWVDDPVDLMLLHIQGSGRVALADGTVVRVGYAASNGHPFVGIGKLMLERGIIPRERASMQAIAAWLRAHPDEAAKLIAENPRYIFFRVLDGDGPVGAQGVALTPGRSLAVDPAFVPLGVPLWLDAADPDGAPLRRLMVAQDTGSAIKGPVRGDFFWGHGDKAFDKAGRMKSRGGYYLLLPRQRSAAVAQVDIPLAIARSAFHPSDPTRR